MAIPVVQLLDLQPSSSGIVNPPYSTAAEKLAVALSRTRVAVVALPRANAACLRQGLQALLASGTQSLPGCEVREWRVGGQAEPAAIEEVRGARGKCDGSTGQYAGADVLVGCWMFQGGKWQQRGWRLPACVPLSPSFDG